MPKKATAKQVESVAETVQASTPAPVSTTSVNSSLAQSESVPKKQRASRKKTADATTASTSEVVSESAVEVTESEVPCESETKTRTPPTRESVEAEFTTLLASVDEEIDKHRTTPGKTKGVKFLRSMRKNLLNLKTHVMRLVKKPQVSRRNNANSGFLKPVQISKELAKFTGWDQNQLRSRVDVTKFICEYIKQHNLQDPEDKRKIRIETDPNLKKLLRFDSKEGKPLTYYSLQTYLKNHFTSTNNNTSSVSSVPK